MAKYSKRQTRKTSETPAVQATASTSSSQSTGFNPDYSYVTKDLRRIGILAGSFIVILVAISFFLR